MSESKLTTLNLPRGSIELLLSMLGAPGWTSKRREMTAAGFLCEKLEPLTDSRPIFDGDSTGGVPTDQVAFKAFRLKTREWERVNETVNLTDSEFQACCSALKHFSDEKKVPSNFHGATLLQAFKLTE